MYMAFVLLWIIFNGKITAEIVILGFVVAAVMFAFICKFMGYSIKSEIMVMKNIPFMLHYAFVLVCEIVKANFATIQMITTSKYELEPVLIHFKTNLKSEIARVILANSITLTPGTITVSLEKDELVVHCLDKDFSEGIEHSVFVALLEKMEALNEKKGL